MTFVIASGTFTTPATVVPVNLSIVPGFDEFRLVNLTDMGSAAANSNIITAYASSDMPAGTAIIQKKSGGADLVLDDAMLAAGGITSVPDSSAVAPGPAVAITATTQANPAVVSTGSTAGLVAGQSIVRIINNANMQQISGMEFTVGTIVANTSFQLKFLDSTAFAAAGTTGFYRIIPYDHQYQPTNRFITNISQAAQAIVTFSVTHGYAVDEFITFTVPSAFGMTQLDQVTARIVAVGAADASGITNTVTIDLDTTGFTAFTFPTSAVAAGGVTFAQAYPAGDFATTLAGSMTNTAFRGVNIGTATLVASKRYQWFAYAGA